MNNNLEKFGETAKGLAQNPIGIIALFIVLVYGFAALVITFANSLTPIERLPIIWFLIIFPVLVLFTFAWLVTKHHTKLYGPMDYKDEANYIKAIKTVKKDINGIKELLGFIVSDDEVKHLEYLDSKSDYCKKYKVHERVLVELNHLISLGLMKPTDKERINEGVKPFKKAAEDNGNKANLLEYFEITKEGKEYLKLVKNYFPEKFKEQNRKWWKFWVRP